MRRTAHVAQLGQLLGEHLVDACGTRLAAEGAHALRQEPRVIRLALGDDEMAGPQDGVRLVLGPGGVQGGAPALERAEHVQAFEHLVPGGCVHRTHIPPGRVS